jgi:hypothetical protein
MINLERVPTMAVIKRAGEKTGLRRQIFGEGCLRGQEGSGWGNSKSRGLPTAFCVEISVLWLVPLPQSQSYQPFGGQSSPDYWTRPVVIPALRGVRLPGLAGRILFPGPAPSRNVLAGSSCWISPSMASKIPAASVPGLYVPVVKSNHETDPLPDSSSQTR